MKGIKLILNEREIEFNFGLSFVGELLDETALPLELIVERMTTNPFKMIPTIMFISAKYAALRKGLELDYTVYDLGDWIDETGGINTVIIEKFLEAFEQSLMRDVPKEEVEPVDPKKKLKS